MATILAISSQVARGSIGLSAIVPALQTLGHSVLALPTILLSNHPGYAHVSGQRTDAAVLKRMIDALDANGWLGEIDTILSGYLPSPEHVCLVAETVVRVRRVRPDCRYLCDPVLGDDPKGLYIDQAAAADLRKLLVPIADTLTPNRFELEWLSGVAVTSPRSAIIAARSLSAPEVIATSIAATDHSLLTLQVAKANGVFCRVQRRVSAPNGTGDLLSGLIAGGFSLGRAVAAVDAVLSASLGFSELKLSQSRDAWLAAKPITETNIDDVD